MLKYNKIDYKSTTIVNTIWVKQKRIAKELNVKIGNVLETNLLTFLFIKCYTNTYVYIHTFSVTLK